MKLIKLRNVTLLQSPSVFLITYTLLDPKQTEVVLDFILQKSLKEDLDFGMELGLETI